MTKPGIQVTSVTIGTSQPHNLARFYAKLLGFTISDLEGSEIPGEAAWAHIKPEDGSFPYIGFEFEQQFRRPVWPAEPGKQTASQHLDIHVDDLPAAVAWAIECGAEEMEFQPQETVRVMRDPDGHPFCLFL